LIRGERQFAIVPGASRAAALGNNRAQLWHAMHSFLTMPPRADVRQPPRENFCRRS
jgi:hypothetical protein